MKKRVSYVCDSCRKVIWYVWDKRPEGMVVVKGESPDDKHFCNMVCVEEDNNADESVGQGTRQ